MMETKKRKGNDKRIPGIIVIGKKKYGIKLIIFPKEEDIVEVMANFYQVQKVKFKEVRAGIIPIIYLVKTLKTLISKKK